MSFERIRQEIYGAVNKIHKEQFKAYNLIIEYDNVIAVNTDTQKLPFMQVRIKFLDADQADMSDRPIKRVYGQIHLATAAPPGSGSSQAFQTNDFFTERLERKRLGGPQGTRTRVGIAGDSFDHGGWRYYPVLIPFWSDKVTNPNV